MTAPVPRSTGKRNIALKNPRPLIFLLSRVAIKSEKIITIGIFTRSRRELLRAGIKFTSFKSACLKLSRNTNLSSKVAAFLIDENANASE